MALPEQAPPRLFDTVDAACWLCRGKHGQPLPRHIGHLGHLEVGHRMYQLPVGRIAACLITNAARPAC